MIYIKNIFKFCFVIIGTIIGAGFASGREIYTFFCVYGINGLFGILISNGIIGFVIFLTSKKVLAYNIKSYSDLTCLLSGSNKIIKYTINNIMNIFLFVCFIVMVSGFGSYFNQEFNIPAYFGAILISILAFFTFFKNIDGIVKINTLLIPILVFLIILLGFKEDFYLFSVIGLPTSTNASWLLKSILYASYNSIVLIPIIINMQDLISNKAQIKYVIFITLLIMIIMSCTIFMILNLNIHEIKNLELPIVFIANKFGLIYKYLYGLVILIAIFTTAISEGYSFLENVSKNKKQYFIYSIIICFLSIVFSNIGFGKLLNLLYPILGYLGLLQIWILCMPIKNIY